MACVPLRLERNKLNAAIAMFTEPYLEQAHYLLAANHSPRCGSASKGFLERLSTPEIDQNFARYEAQTDGKSRQ
jgi:hypothetical protein